MPVEILTDIPAQITAGDTCKFTQQFTDFPVGTWTMAFVLSRGTAAPVSTAATTSGALFLTTLSAAVTAALNLTGLPLRYSAACYVTSGTERTSARPPVIIDVLPNLAITAAPSAAQVMLTALDAAITTLSGSLSISVSFNGQSYTKQSLGDLMRQRTYLAAEVHREQLHGQGPGGRIPIEFLSPYER